jgi:DNA mismatch repair protein MutH
MRINDILPKLQKLVNRPFSEIFNKQDMHDIIVAKGRSGLLLEKALGLPQGTNLTDFEDGELKTNKSRGDGTPLETMFITQISRHVDELFNIVSFDQTWLYKKIKRILYVPVVKEDESPLNWYFKHYYDVRIEPDNPFYSQIKKDYHTISQNIIKNVEHGDGMLHTSSGRFIQIRTKDAEPYTPIFSNKYKKYVSNKNFAFYFRKDFMLEVQRLEKLYGDRLETK